MHTTLLHNDLYTHNSQMYIVKTNKVEKEIRKYYSSYLLELTKNKNIIDNIKF